MNGGERLQGAAASASGAQDARPPAAAYRVDGEIVSPERFYALACDPARPVVVEACAGAGKTWMLVSRILRALLQGARPQEILAITFTRKAAGEMRVRLQEWLLSLALCPAEERVQQLMQRGLAEAEARQAEPRLAALHGELLEAGQGVEIRTFHGWFGQLLRQAPLSVLEPLGLHADMATVEDTTALQRACWRPFLRVVQGDPQLKEDFVTLVQARSRQSVRAWLEAALEKRVEFALADAAGVLDDSVPPAGRLWPHLPLEQGWAGVMDSPRMRQVWIDARDALVGGRTKTGETVRLGLDSALGLSGEAAFLALRKLLLTTEGMPKQKVSEHPAVQQAFSTVLALAEAHSQASARDMHLRMVRLTRAWLAVYARHKQQRGLADMADLEHAALHLLRDATLSGWVLERLDARVRHLLIDEFQDTSPLQWQALRAWLSAYAGAGGGAGAPSVFIVGDPKQSIYRFRGAEPRVFTAAQAFVRETFSGVLLACDHTRRNAPAVIEAVNACFAQVGQWLPYPGFRPHTTASDALGTVHAHPRFAREAEAGQAAAAARREAWRDSLREPREAAAEHLRLREARCVARHVVSQIEQGLEPSQVQVLARKRETLRLVAQALREAGVPHVAPEATRLMDTPEAQDLVALLDALVSPRHHLSLARALRSPVFACSDQELIDLAQAARRTGPWWSALIAGAWPEAGALARAAHWLPRWREAMAHLPPHDLLARVMADGRVRERYACALPPEARARALEHLDALLALALDLDGGRYATPYGFVRSMRREAAEVSATARAQAVQLLTIHGAKGLEAELVCLVDTDPEAPRAEGAGVLIEWPTEAAHPARMAFIAKPSACPASLRALRDAELEAAWREEFNALYVAMTRARRSLVFSATEPHRARSQPGWPQALQALGLTPPPERPDTPRVQAIARQAERVRLTVLPEPRSVPTVPAGGPRAPADDPDAAVLGRVVHRAMEHMTLLPTAARTPEARARVLQAAVREDGASASQADAAAEVLERWLGAPGLARWLDPAGCAWAANELSLAHGGEVLRIDRLVRLEGQGAWDGWWVLDYKLEHRPQERPAYLQQLRRYREALRAALGPGDSTPVRSAFIAGGGDFVPVEEGGAGMN